MKKAYLFSLITVAAAITGIIACSKNGVSPGTSVAGQQKVSLYLTDGPGYFDNVFIDIKTVNVWVDTSAHGEPPRRHWRHEDSLNGLWQTLTITPGLYDLLALRNGLDTLLAAGTLPKGKVKLIKIELGTNNSVVKDSVTYPLNLFKGDSSFVLINLQGDEWDEYTTGQSRLWLDFDISRSIINWHNAFYLRPFLRSFIEKNTSRIAGVVLPRAAFPVVTVYNGTDTAYALPEHEGRFKVRGLQPGVYTVYVNGSNGYQDTTISNVTVTSGNETSVGTINLHK